MVIRSITFCTWLDKDEFSSTESVLLGVNALTETMTDIENVERKRRSRLVDIALFRLPTAAYTIVHRFSYWKLMFHCTDVYTFVSQQICCKFCRHLQHLLRLILESTNCGESDSKVWLQVGQLSPTNRARVYDVILLVNSDSASTHLSRYVTSHPGQLSLAIPSWVGAMSTSQRAVMPCGWGE